MSFELINCWSFVAIIVEHLKDEVLKFRGKRLSSNLLPVLLKLVVKDQIVKVLVFLSLFEWEDTLDDDEEDDTG